jgi:oligopeptide transport system ATP-binding protein
LDKGKILGIVGESGSGKSVSSYSIMRILDKNGTIDKGQILFEGEDLTKASEKRMQEIRGNRIAMIFQDPMTGLNPVYTIGNQLMEAVRTHHKDMDKKDIYKKCVDMLTLVGFNEPVKRMKQYPFEFSGGMLQRAMIAMALVCDPDLLIADEPTTALDVTIQAQILDLLKSIQEKLGMAIIIITHDLGVVAQICDEVDVMYAGRVVERGTADEIFYNPQHEYTKGLLESVPTLKDKDLHPIKGNPINLLALPKGCPFSPRCDHCMKICIEKYPESLQINDQHIVSCWNAVKALQDKGEIDVMAAPDPEKVKEEEELAEHDPSTQKKMSVLLKGLVSDKDKKEDSNV